MSASSRIDAVRQVSESAALEAGLVIENVVITSAGRRRVLRVVVDLPDDASGGVSMDSVARVSSAISAALEESDLMGELPYVLEVSSPGIDRPLTEKRHWMRARGRLVTAELADGTSRAGRLTEVDDDGLHLSDAVTVAWADVVRGRVEVDFSRAESAELGPELDDEEGTD